jgi:hypothetical protein
MTKPYPWYYAVNDRPVKLVELPDGSLDALVFDFSTGGFVPDRSYFGRTSDPSGDVDQLTEEQFSARVHALRAPICAKRRATTMTWEITEDRKVPLRSKVGDRILTIRLNDSPTDPPYTLLVDGEAVEDLDAWPEAWPLPRPF